MKAQRDQISAGHITSRYKTDGRHRAVLDLASSWEMRKDEEPGLEKNVVENKKKRKGYLTLTTTKRLHGVGTLVDKSLLAEEALQVEDLPQA